MKPRRWRAWFRYYSAWSPISGTFFGATASEAAEHFARKKNLDHVLVALADPQPGDATMMWEYRIKTSIKAELVR